jgi:peptide/nickel transport system substrate-binding protein
MFPRSLPWLAIALLPFFAAACARTGAEEVRASRFPAGLSAKESPLLAERVAEGRLPPLKDRLPSDPLVVRPYERPGIYGGTWHLMHDNPDLGMYKMIAGYATMMRWRADCMGIEPGLARSWEFNRDGSELTIHLRHGIKWSDGVEYTSEDFAFWYQLCTDPREKFKPPYWCLVNGRPMRVEAPDKYTIVMRFAGPNWFVPLHLATGFWWADEYVCPKHYMMQFHPDLNRKYRDFVEFDRRNESYANPDRPTLWPWRLARIEDGGNRIKLERNPYYWMVDTLGRQLPYIDHVESSLVLDPQVRVLKVLAGEVDCQFRRLELRDLALFVQGQKRGGYHILRWKSASGADTSVLLNWSAPDPVLRPLIRDKRFRRALSLAIDRDKCNEIAWRGLGVPQQATVSRESWHFQDPAGKKLFDEWAHNYADFDLPRANRLLDDMGLTKRDPAGYRLRPDGRRLSLTLEVSADAQSGPEPDDALIIRDGWEKLGIEVLIITPPGAEFSNRLALGLYTASTFGEAEMDLFTYPDWVFPTEDKYWHPAVGKWYKTGGKEGEAPTGPVKALLDIYDRIKTEPSLEKRHKLVQDAVRIHINEGPFNLGTAAREPVLVIVKNNMHNVPPTGILGPWAVSGPASSFPEQFYFAHP